MSQPAELNGADAYDLLISRAAVSDRMRRTVDERIREQAAQSTVPPGDPRRASSAG